MSQIVDNDPLVMEAVAELQRFSSDPAMRELERRRKLWKLEYYSGLEAAKAEGEAKGKAEGEAKGKAEGLVEGEAKGEVRAIIRTLTKRFNQQPPKALEEKLLAMTDLEQLDKLAEFAFDCDSMAEFETALK